MGSKNKIKKRQASSGSGDIRKAFKKKEESGNLGQEDNEKKADMGKSEKSKGWDSETEEVLSATEEFDQDEATTTKVRTHQKNGLGLHEVKDSRNGNESAAKELIRLVKELKNDVKHEMNIQQVEIFKKLDEVAIKRLAEKREREVERRKREEESSETLNLLKSLESGQNKMRDDLKQNLAELEKKVNKERIQRIETEKRWEKKLSELEKKQEEKLKEIDLGRSGIDTKELQQLKWKVEQEERHRKKNNIVIKGLNTRNKKETEEWLRKEFCMKIDVKRWWRFGEKKELMGVEMNSRGEKEGIMKKKKKLKDTVIYIENDLTWEERRVRRILQDRVNTVRGEGGEAKITGYMSIIENGQVRRWDQKNNQFFRLNNAEKFQQPDKSKSSSSVKGGKKKFNQYRMVERGKSQEQEDRNMVISEEN